ncbi:MAG: hypothetical protein K2N56_10505 [Oscillospiraceae bacterium]|nr:hypothetical protein [Oscillospiraceae bacterium]
MRRLTKRQLINSLIFPVGIIVWALFCYIKWAVTLHSFQPVFMFQWSYPAATVVCGVLPVVLTLATGADTGQYFLPRLLISVSTIGVIGIASEFVDVSSQMMMLLLITSAVVSAVYFYQFRPTKFSEWIIIFFANPVLAAIIYYLMLYIPNNIYV